VIVSSHVLNEVERLAERVIVLIHGRLAAAGGHHAIRDAMDDRPRHVLVRSDDGRRLAAALIGLESVGGVTVDAVRGGLVIQTLQARDLATALPRLARDESVRLLEVRALDDSLESLFRELVR
jgi:ABC-2 type transport system ATP-binding protein